MMLRCTAATSPGHRRVGTSSCCGHTTATPVASGSTSRVLTPVLSRGQSRQEQRGDTSARGARMQRQTLCGYFCIERSSQYPARSSQKAHLHGDNLNLGAKLNKSYRVKSLRSRIFHRVIGQLTLVPAGWSRHEPQAQITTTRRFPAEVPSSHEPLRQQPVSPDPPCTAQTAQLSFLCLWLRPLPPPCLPQLVQLRQLR